MKSRKSVELELARINPWFECPTCFAFNNSPEKTKVVKCKKCGRKVRVKVRVVEE